MHPSLYAKFRNRVVFNADGVAGGGAQQPPQPAAEPQASGAQSSTSEVSDNTFDLNSINIWAPKPQTQTSQAVSVPQMQTAAPDPMAQFEQHVNGLSFGKLELDTDQLQRFIQHGDMEGFSTAINGMMRGAYKQVMLDASRMISSMREQITADAVEKAKNVYGAQRTFDDLVKEVPLAGNANISPIAQAVYKQFRTNGQDHAAAVRGVKSFLNTIRGTKETDIGLPPRAAGNQRMSGFEAAASDEEMIDWMAFAQQ